MLEDGYIQTFIDFFYITHQTTPSMIKPNPRLDEQWTWNIGVKLSLKQTEDELTSLSEDLQEAERYYRMGDNKCLKFYGHLIWVFEGNLKDFETSSYFHDKCLQFSVNHKFWQGEIEAYKGLGVCED